ncbi:hypothetical protein HOK51_08665 [Candidatus Woesearchaeota archaeon]|jgi:hypothetical protein|nr:hypothetical protein [Candidatus Woesearchaeota archaeon]MBT6519899.1 hypothetical protein [Candidatus Woesearchaeota archaeon]MBT7367125.1 hypothetical protein [Candidatus Woesearchaeota archaeon]
MTFTKQDLLETIHKMHSQTYCAPKEVRERNRAKIIDGHKGFLVLNGDWKYVDFYSGHEWAPGKEIMYFKEKPVWTMSYQGQVDDRLSEDFINETYGFLKSALLASSASVPFRGLDGFCSGDFKYEFKFDGEYSYFVGRESVMHKGSEIFFQDVMGSLIK